MKRIAQGALTAAGLVATTATLVMAQDAFRIYYANDPVGRNVVMIESRAPIETILTRTNQVTGEIHLNPANVLENPQARFELDTASLDNGIPLRNEHMRSAMWLDTAKYPKATFTLTRPIQIGRSGPLPSLANITGKPLEFNVEGTLELHGVTHPVQAKIEVMPIAGGPDTA
ncbi:MAG: YceI family protein, partial [Abitibacteriaceae bacterium]|nr:YceI family protein [Abditibacteriaceae bacterium]